MQKNILGHIHNKIFSFVNKEEISNPERFLTKDKNL
jgi:hypothetical protein